MNTLEQNGETFSSWIKDFPSLLHFFFTDSILHFCCLFQEIRTDSKKEKLNFIIEFYN